MDWFTRSFIVSLLKFVAFLVVVGLFIALVVAWNRDGWYPEANVPDLKLTPSDVVNYFQRQQQQPTKNNLKVIIVGAGASGMFAAYTLEYLGIDYELLEANSNTFGGRVQEMNDFIDVPLDLGAEWIHVHPKILNDLLLFPTTSNTTTTTTNNDIIIPDDDVDVKTITFQPQSYGIYTFGKQKSRNVLRHFYAEHKFYNTTWYSYLKDYIYPYIADNMHLNAVVQEIHYGTTTTTTEDEEENDGDNSSSHQGEVTVTTRDGQTYTGSHVIVATPISILQDGDIVFDPPLTSKKQKAIDQVYTPSGLKVWIEFDQKFYPDMQYPGGILNSLREDKLYVNAVYGKPTLHNVLLLFQVDGSEADRRVTMEEDALIADVLNELDTIFDGQASAHYVQHRIMNWSAQPFIKGAYSYNSYNMEAILEPVGDQRNIYFCGEYLNAGEYDQATVHGAAMSGRAVAQQLLLDVMK